MYRDPDAPPPKPEGEPPSLEELAAKGGRLRDRHDWARRKDEERVAQEARDAVAEEVTLRENAFLAGRAPLARFSFIAGIVALVFGGMMTASVLWTMAFSRTTSRKDASTEQMALVLVPLGTALFLLGRARRRRVLAAAKAWLAAFPYPVEGYFGVFGVDWNPHTKSHTHPFGRLMISVRVRSSVDGDARLADALAAVAEGTLSTVAPDHLEIRSQPFVGGADAHRWLTSVLDGLAPALHRAHDITRIDLYCEAAP